MQREPQRQQREPSQARGLPPLPREVHLAAPKSRFDGRRIFYMVAGIAVFLGLYLAPALPAVHGPQGRVISLTPEGQAALGLFGGAALWWAFEVVPLGVTGILVGLLQAVFLIRPARAALGDFLDPAVWFIVGALAMSMAFARTGLTRRLAYAILGLFGERTRLIYLGAFATVGVLTLVMAHTAAAAALFPLLMAIYPLYDETRQPTRFGKGLFIGLAFTSSAGSIMTLLGSSRAAIGVGLFARITGEDCSFARLSLYLLPLGCALVLAFWGLVLVLYPPERSRIAGLSQRLQALRAKLGPLSAAEIKTSLIAALALVALIGGSFTPGVAALDKTAVVLAAMLALFVAKVLTIDELESLPWNIVLLLGAAMSLGVCLWQTGAAEWLAAYVGGLAQGSAVLLVVGLSVTALALTNAVVNVATLALCLPVALAFAPSGGLPPSLVLFVALASAGLPLMLLVGAAPNALAFESRQFTSGEFARAGLLATLLAAGFITFFATLVWPHWDPVARLAIR
jgi:sodium-dependent dicarboxylate transporter 2/3/5